MARRGSPPRRVENQRTRWQGGEFLLAVSKTKDQDGEEEFSSSPCRIPKNQMTRRNSPPPCRVEKKRKQETYLWGSTNRAGFPELAPFPASTSSSSSQCDG